MQIRRLTREAVSQSGKIKGLQIIPRLLNGETLWLGCTTMLTQI